MHSPGAAVPVPEPPESFDLGASEETLAKIRDWLPVYGDFFRVYSPRRRVYSYVVNDPEAVKRVLLTNHRNYVKGVGTDQISILLGRGIMTSSGDDWQRQRRMLQPAFHRRVLSGFGGAIAQTNEEYASRWDAVARHGVPLNVTEAASELTLDINLRAIFGDDLALIRERFGANPFSIVHTEADRDLRFAYRIRSLGTILQELIDRRRANPQEKRVDFFEMALEAEDKETGERMSDRQLIDELITLVVAGHETTASALTWTWYLLGRHPEIQEELAASTLGLPALSTLGLEGLEGWAVGQQVIKESLRLCPPGWMIARRTVAPDVLHGVALAAATDVFISPYFLHRHPAHWQDPERFDPSRFAPAAEAARHRFVYIPFGVGPRHCIGEALATFEMATHLAVMSRRFRLTPVSDETPRIEARINYRLRSDLSMWIEPR